MPWDCLLPSEPVHTLSMECVPCRINLLSLYHGSLLSSFLHKAEDPHLAAHPRYSPEIWDMTILSSSTFLQHLELKCRPECTMWVVHPSSPTDAQFRSLLESFVRGNLEAHDDLSCVSLGNINLYNSIAFDYLGSQVLLSSPKSHCEGISPSLYPIHSAMWWLPSATSYPQFKSPETKVDVSGTNHHLNPPHRQGVQRHWLQAGCRIHTREETESPVLNAKDLKRATSSREMEMQTWSHPM